MASNVGFQLVAGRIPGERIATSIHNSDSAAFDSETELITVDAPVVSGRTYRVRLVGGFDPSVADDVLLLLIREDSSTGSSITGRRFVLDTTVGATGIGIELEVEYTADATEIKTFSVTGAVSGSGTVVMDGGSPGYLYVDYIRG